MTTIINQRVAPLYVLPLVRCEHRPNGVADPAAALKLLRHKSYKLRSEEPIGLHELPASLPMSSSLEMQLFWWYGSSAVCILAALLFRRIQHKIYRVLGRWSRYLAYIILIRRGFWSAISITVLDAIVLLVFIGVNTALAVFSLRSSLIQIAVTNLIPLFLGGRTNFVADFLNIPLHTYHLGHRWLGRVVIAQALTHSIINFDSRTGSPPALSGLAGAILLSVNLITSSLPVRRCSPLLFLWTHRILALSSLGVITLHVYLCKNNLTSFAFAVCLIATGLFVASFVLRWGRVWYQRRAEVTHYEIVGGAIRLWVRTRHSVESRPGAYFYISFPGAPWRYRLQSYFIPVAFWSSEMRDTTRELSFLLHPELPKALRLHLERDLERNHKTRVKLDGAYGERIGIEQFDLVILTADGQGIAGVVSFALSALSRWKFDRKDKAEEHNSSLYGDKTRKIDLIWLLEDNSQVEWASPYFRALADMDQASKVFSFYSL